VKIATAKASAAKKAIQRKAAAAIGASTTELSFVKVRNSFIYSVKTKH
jgi:hypothetical protein